MFQTKLFTILLSIAFSLFTISSFACNCNKNTPFLTASYGADLISIVKIEQFVSFEKVNGKTIPTGMRVEVLEVLKGKETREFITIWGNNGMMNRPYLNTFKENGLWVMALKGDGNNKENNADYSLSNCGEQFMRLTIDNMIEGYVNGAEYDQWSISELKTQLHFLNANTNVIHQKKQTIISELLKEGIEEIAVLEIDLAAKNFRIKPDAKTSVDPLYGEFFLSFQEKQPVKQLFVFWKEDDETYIQQLNQRFTFLPVAFSNSELMFTFSDKKKALKKEAFGIVTYFETSTTSLPIKETSLEVFSKEEVYACNLEALQEVGYQNTAFANVLRIAKEEAVFIQSQNMSTTILFELYKQSKQNKMPTMVKK